MSSIDEQCQEEPSTQTLEPPWDPYYWRLVYGSSPSDYTMESMSYGSPTIECGGYDGFTPHTIADGGADQLPYPTGTTAKDDLVCLPSPLHLVGNNAENPIVIFGGEEIKPMSVPFRRGYSTGHAFAEQWRRNRSARNLTSNTEPPAQSHHHESQPQYPKHGEVQTPGIASGGLGHQGYCSTKSATTTTPTTFTPYPTRTAFRATWPSPPISPTYPPPHDFYAHAPSHPKAITWKSSSSSRGASRASRWRER